MKPRQAFLRAIRSAVKLDIQARYLAMEMAYQATDELTGELTNKELAEAIGSAVRNVERWVSMLSKEGFFIRTGRRSWRLIPPVTVIHTDTDGGLSPPLVAGSTSLRPPTMAGSGSETANHGGFDQSETANHGGYASSQPANGGGLHIRERASDPDPVLTSYSKTNTPSDLTRARGEGERKSNFPDSGAEDLRSRCSRWIRDPVVTGLNLGSPDTWPELLEATEYFTAVTACQVKATPKHPAIRMLVERFAEGYTSSDVKAAIDGANRDPWMAKNPQFHNLQTILRDGGQIERFRNLAQSNRPPPAHNPRGRPIQPTYPGEGDYIDSKHKVIRT